MPNYSKLAKGLTSFVKGAQEVLPAAEREANLSKFLEPSVEKGRLYHGTGQGDISAFKSPPRKKVPSGYMWGQKGDETYSRATFLSPEPEMANHFAKRGTKLAEDDAGQYAVYPVRAQIERPFDYQNPEHRKMLERFFQKQYDDWHKANPEAKRMPDVSMEHLLDNPDMNFQAIESPEMLHAIEKLGFDSFYTSEGRAKNIGVFDPSRIKSDIGNRGTYDMSKPEINEAKGGAIRMQVGGLSALAKLGKAGTRLSKVEEAALRARGMGVPGVDFADPLLPPGMRMSEALGAAGAEGKYLNFTEADRSRVFGNNMGGTGFSALQHYSEPHKQAGTVWGFGNKSTAEKKIRQNDPDNTIWTTYAGSPEQHKSNTVVVKDAVKNLQDANAKGTVHPEQVKLINDRIRQATNDKGAPLFPSDFDITDPQALSLATTFDRRTAISDALMGTGVKKPMISREFKEANPGVKWSDASDIGRILTRETDPVLANANTFDVGPHFFTMDNKIIHRPDLNEAFPVQVTGTDLGLRYQPAPFRNAAPDFIKEKGYGPNDPINAWAMSRGNPRQFVDEKYLTGLQKEGHKDGGTVTPSFTQRLNSAIERHMDETIEKAKGGQVHMPIRSLRQIGAQRMAGGGVPGLIKTVVEGASKTVPKVDRLSMSYKDVTKRVPEVAEAIEKLSRGEITKAQYNDIVNMYKPVTPYNFVPKPATKEEAIDALRGDAAKSRYGAQAEYEPGAKIGLRLDIPAYTNKGVWVNSIHDEKAKKVAYGPVASVKNADLGISQNESKRIALGGAKAPYAKIKGEWNPMTEEEAVAKAQEYLDHPEWRQIGMDPERHSYFYDRATMQPITNADEVIQIGPLVLGKNPKYGKMEDFEYDEGGYVDPFGAPDAPSTNNQNMVELAGRMIKNQAQKEGAVLSTPQGRRDIALKVASHLPGLGMGGDLVALADWVQTLIPGLYEEKPTSVMESNKKPGAPYRDTRELQRVPKFALRNIIPSPTGEEFQEKFKEAGWQGENEAPMTELAASLFAPGAMAKVPKIAGGIKGGLTAVAPRSLPKRLNPAGQ